MAGRLDRSSRRPGPPLPDDPIPECRAASRSGSGRGCSDRSPVSGVTVDGLRYEVRVRGHGVPVLLLHGFTGRGSGWAPHATALARHFRVIVVDLPGHGRSGTPTDPTRASVER
ncbi:MAG: alpha/beta fold hydrolase, partial [Thermomicrobiales bacterium]